MNILVTGLCYCFNLWVTFLLLIYYFIIITLTFLCPFFVTYHFLHSVTPIPITLLHWIITNAPDPV